MDVGEVTVGAVESLDGIELTTASVGNPHAVIRLDDPTRDDLLRLGPLIETHERFPERTNVQLVRVDGRHDLFVLVWERGAGETSASGSSSVAAAAVAVERGWCDSPVTVHLPGGICRCGWRTGRRGSPARPSGLPGARRLSNPGVRLKPDSARRRMSTFSRTSGLRPSDGDLELAQDVVERRLQIGRCAALTDDQRARQAVGAGRELLLADAGQNDLAGRHLAAVLDRLGPVTSMIGTDADSTTFGAITAPAPIRTPSTITAREPMKAPSSMITGAACGGSSTPPMPTPPARWTSAPICAQEPTVAHVSTIVRGPTQAPMLT